MMRETERGMQRELGRRGNGKGEMLLKEREWRRKGNGEGMGRKRGTMR